MPKSVLITGAARGIGLACAQKFAASGYSVCIHFNTSAKEAEAAAAALAGPGKHCTAQADLSERGAPAKLIADAVAKLGGGLDVCVANHGIYEETPFEETDAAAAAFEQQALDSLKRAGALDRVGSGAFMPACIDHPLAWYGNIFTNDAW